METKTFCAIGGGQRSVGGCSEGVQEDTSVCANPYLAFEKSSEKRLSRHYSGNSNFLKKFFILSFFVAGVCLPPDSFLAQTLEPEPEAPVPGAPEDPVQILLNGVDEVMGRIQTFASNVELALASDE